MSSASAIMNRGTLSVPGTRETLFLTQIELPSLRRYFFSNLKLSSFSLQQLYSATILLVVGTLGSVYPAAGLVNIANQMSIRTVYVGPEEPLNVEAFDEIILGTAAVILPRLLGAQGRVDLLEASASGPFYNSEMVHSFPECTAQSRRNLFICCDVPRHLLHLK